MASEDLRWSPGAEALPEPLGSELHGSERGAQLSAALRCRGFAQLWLPPRLGELNAACFAAAEGALEAADAGTGPGRLDPSADAGDASGAHAAGALSRYNANRSGFIFSNGDLFDLDGSGSGPGSFVDNMASFFEAQRALAVELMEELAASLGLQAGWFASTLGDVARSSQWHVKRYCGSGSGSGEVLEDGRQVLMPMHTDPSIISIVLLDRPGVQPGALGLEVQFPGASSSSQLAGANDRRRTWAEVPWSGHGVATIFAGSVLERISGGLIPAAKHRVVEVSSPCASGRRRTAATFFFRPAESAVLRLMPASDVLALGVPDRPMAWAEWKRRVSANYGGGRGGRGGRGKRNGAESCGRGRGENRSAAAHDGADVGYARA